MTNQTQITVHFSFRQWDNRNELLVKEIVSQPKELVEDPDGIQDRPQTRLFLCARGQIPLLDLNMFVFFFKFQSYRACVKRFHIALYFCSIHNSSLVSTQKCIYRQDTVGIAG